MTLYRNQTWTFSKVKEQRLRTSEMKLLGRVKKGYTTSGQETKLIIRIVELLRKFRCIRQIEKKICPE